MFPAEIYEKILYYADGTTLLMAKHVCKQWKEIVEYLENKYKIWEQRCKTEIPEYFLHTMQDKCGYVNHISEKWKVLFENYISWQAIKNKNFYVLPKQSSEYFESNITCARISGSRILYGTSSGIICVLNEEYEVEDVIITDIRGSLKEIIFLNEVEDKKSTEYNHTHVLVVYEKCFLILKLEPKISQIAMYPQILHVSVYADLIAYADVDGTVRVAEFNTECLNLLTLISFCRLFGPQKTIRSLCIVKNEVIIITDSKMFLFQYRLKPALYPTAIQSVPFPYSMVEKYWTFYNNILFCTVNSQLLFCTINKDQEHIVMRKFNCMQILESPVCDIFLYGNVLILGMFSGKLFIYVVDDWSEFELENYDLKINIYGEPIHSIDVQELNNEHRLVLAMNNYLAQLFIYH